MSFLDNLKQQAKKEESSALLLPFEYQLTTEEVELILTLVGETVFPVKKIEVLYKALWKLQEQHKLLKNGK